ncbi:MAG TPA: ATP-binding protein, partial [Thermoanaerobaculia bacterium]|nr:ATP-binding protein [Thermoanaerobaculia bacterium]
LARAARESLSAQLAGRPVAVRIAQGCPDLWVDPALALEILANLLENAERWSPPEAPIELTAAVFPGGEEGAPRRVAIEVLDRGPGPPSSGGDDAPSGGLGLLIVRSLAAQLHGSFALTPRPGGGAIARVELPAAAYADDRESPERRNP